MSSSVKVAVRVRPFNQREINLNAVNCLDMNGPVTIISDLSANPPVEKKFTFDHSFWSHDSFITDPKTGMAAPDGPYSKYADQNHVFNVLGQEVLNNAWEGYHCCLFAYGQTGSGKSYSMVGYGADRGIVPMACEEIFHRVAKNTDTNKRYEVYVSMLEIYNECVYDLLLPSSKRDAKGLDIRESKIDGVFVQDLSKTPVNSYEEIDAQVQLGTSNRSVGETLMNKSSSRAHTVVIIRFEQVTIHEGGKEGRKISVINLVDLAGSEKAEQTGATGDRLKEGCNINKSLSALGNVIKALADVSDGKAKKGSIIVPYRDSKLTRLLQNALGGSSKTIMICALSPANTNYEETLSTLRYADRAKAIKNAAVINEDPAERRMRELTEENERLKQLLAGGGGGSGGGGDSAAIEEEKKRLEEEMRQMTMSWEQKLKEAQEAAAAAAAAAAASGIDAASASTKLSDWCYKAHLYNLNEDTTLSGKLKYAFKEDSSILIGKRPRANDPTQIEVPIAGTGISAKHASIVYSAGASEAQITTLDGSAVVFINGEKIKGGASHPIKSGDVIVVGETYAAVFRVYIPDRATNPTDEALLSALQDELNKHAGGDAYYSAIEQVTAVVQAKKSAAEEAEEKARREEFEAHMRAVEDDKKRAEEELRKREEEFQARLREMEAKLSSEEEKRQIELELAKARQAAELEAQRAAAKAEQEKRDLERKELLRVSRDQMIKRLDEQLREVMPKAKEASIMAEEMGLSYNLRAALSTTSTNDTTGASGVGGGVKVSIKYEGKDVYDWTPEVLDSRLYLMRELYERWASSEDPQSIIDSLYQEEDPYWDPIRADKHIGSAYVSLLALGSMIEVEGPFKIIANNEDGGNGGASGVIGEVHLRIDPADASGAVADEDEYLDIEEPQNLIGRNVHLRLMLAKLKGLPTHYENIHLRYQWHLDGQETLVYPDEHVRDVPGETTLNHKRIIHLTPCTRRFVDWVTAGETDGASQSPAAGTMTAGKLRIDIYGVDQEAVAAEERRTLVSRSRKGSMRDDTATVYSAYAHDANQPHRAHANDIEEDDARSNSSPVRVATMNPVASSHQSPNLGRSENLLESPPATTKLGGGGADTESAAPAPPAAAPVKQITFDEKKTASTTPPADVAAAASIKPDTSAAPGAHSERETKTAPTPIPSTSAAVLNPPPAAGSCCVIM